MFKIKLVGDDSVTGILIVVLVIAKASALVLCSLAMALLLLSHGWITSREIFALSVFPWHEEAKEPEITALLPIAPAGSNAFNQAPMAIELTQGTPVGSQPPLGGGIMQQGDIESRQDVASLPKSSAYMDSGDMVCPPLADITLEQLPAIVSSPYDPPPPGSDERHEGVDFAFYNYSRMKSIQGLSIHSILPGKVAGLVNNRPPYGNMIMIETSYADVSADLADLLGVTPQISLYHVYAHMANPPQLTLGEAVRCGDHLGEVGNTGTIVPHLHLETRHGPAGAVFPTMAFYDTVITFEERDNYLYWRISGAFIHFDPMSIFNAYLQNFNNE